MAELNPLELGAVIFNIIYVILAARKSAWCWPAGILGSALSIVLFLQTRLYAESVLFAYYVVMGFYGWFMWKQSSKGDNGVKIDTWDLKKHLLTFTLGYILTALLFLILKNFTDAEMPLLDSFTTILSFIATWMVARRLLENWIYWMAINALSVYLYLSRELTLYALLAFVFTIMSIYGFTQWKKSAKQGLAL